MVRFLLLVKEIVLVAVVVVVLILLCLPTQIESFIFNLSSGRTKCISEDLQIHAITHAHYRITSDHHPHNHNNNNISARVSDPKGETLHYSENVESGEFAFTANLDGIHTICFWSPQFDPSSSSSSSSSIPIEFEWKAGLPLPTNHLTTAAPILNKDNIHFMELELKKLEESVHAIHDDIMHLRTREEEMLKLNQTTNSRMVMMSLLSLFICLGVAGLQLWHLKAFFERKKIL